MAKIRISSPCHHIHRIILPPDAAFLIHHQFIGGAFVMARILKMLTGSHAPDQWQELINAVPVEKFPDRFIWISRFCPAPAQRKLLKPKQTFLRVRLTYDGDDFDKEIQAAPFEIDLPKGEFDLPKEELCVHVIGGKNTTEALSLPGMKPGAAWPESLGENDVCYLIPKTFEDAIAQLSHVRSRRRDCPVICQMDVEHLARDFPIQTDTSYERTVGDICRTVGRRRTLHQCEYGRLIEYITRPLTPQFDPGKAQDEVFDHFIIRIGNSACLLISRNEKGDVKPEHSQTQKGPDPKMTFFYHPARSAPTRFPSLGDMLSYNLIMACSFVHQISECGNLGKLEEHLHRGARVAVQASYASFLNGFGQIEEKEHVGLAHFKERYPAENLFYELVHQALNIEGQNGKNEGMTCPLPAYQTYRGHPQYPFPLPVPEKPVFTGEREVDYSKAVSPNIFWRMAFLKEEASAIHDPQNCNEALCLKKAREYLLKKEKELPLARIGQLSLVDRHEVEDYLFLQNLLLDYHGDGQRKKPLSIGVFGQPGSGKSFGVKQLVDEMSGDGSTFAKEAITINLSQMRTLGELTESFHRIRDACLSTPIPLVFFDEFDSTLDGTAFGWLKYFLAPMQDGEFIENGKAYHFGKAIFVFAGGVNHSFSEFNERSRNPDFCDAKGPDFTSRLRGILNIRGMNRPEGDEIEHIYMLRRAVFLRENLERRIGKHTPDLIDENLADALLKIQWFKHGVRSLEAILDMSHLRHGETFMPGDLPPRAQLDLHVDARAFLKLAKIGSTRVT